MFRIPPDSQAVEILLDIALSDVERMTPVATSIRIRGGHCRATVSGAPSPELAQRVLRIVEVPHTLLTVRVRGSAKGELEDSASNGWRRTEHWTHYPDERRGLPLLGDVLAALPPPPLEDITGPIDLDPALCGHFCVAPATVVSWEDGTTVRAATPEDRNAAREAFRRGNGVWLLPNGHPVCLVAA